MLPSMRLLAIQPGDSIVFLKDGKEVTARVNGRPALRNNRKPGAARIIIDALTDVPVEVRGETVRQVLPLIK